MYDFFEFSNEMLCVADSRGYFTRVNQAWTKTLEWSKEEMTSRPFIDFVHPDDVAATTREAQLLHSGTHETILFENRYQCRDGSYRWLSWQAKYAPGTKELVATARDVTTLKLQTEALRESEERFRLLAMNSPIGIAQSDAEGRTFFVNPKWCEIAGATPEESMDYGWQDFLHPEDRGRLIEAWQADMAAGKTHSTSEFRFIHKDGSIRWASSTASQILDASGNPVGQIGVTQDITKQRNAERRFQDIYEQSPLGIALIDSQSLRFLQINPRYQQTIGRTEEEMVKLTVEDITHPDDIAADVKYTELMLQGTTRRFQMEKRLRRGDASFMWVNVTIVPMWQIGETPTYHLAISEDITERKAAQNALRESEDRFRAFMDNSSAFAWAKDEQGRFVYLNRASEERLRKHFEEWRGKTDFDFWPQEIAQQFRGNDRKVLESGIPLTVVERSGFGSGPITYSLKSKFSYRDAEGRKYVGGVGIDITELKQAESQLRLRESQLTGILDNTTAVIYLKDSEGHYLLTNRRYQNLFQKGVNSLIGKKDSDIFPEATVRTFMESDAKVWNEQCPLDFEEVAPHADGLHTYRSIKFPVRDESGNMIALGGISTDITDLKEAHEALRAEQELLRNLIEVQEKEKQFLCHEFHDGLIQYAIGSLMLLEAYRNKHPVSETSAMHDKLIGILRKGVEDGRRVIRGVRPAVLDDSGLEAAIEDLIGQYENSGIHITSNCDPEISRLPESIQTTVYRVVQEALSNAKKYSGTDVVRIALKKFKGDLQLEIRDFGCGFDLETARKKGFGLLGMTERVRLLGGECLIQSEQDTGTQISVRLPIPEAEGEKT